MSALELIVTNAGRAALLNAQNTGTRTVLVSQCGISATAITATPGTAALPDEIKHIATLSGDLVADDTIHLVVRDETASAYTVRSIALYLDDGTLFASYGQADPVLQKSAQALMLLACDVRLADIAASAITFGNANFLNPPGTVDTAGVLELATDAEATNGTDAARSLTPKGARAAFVAWIDARFGVGAPSGFVKGLLTLASAAAFRLGIGAAPTASPTFTGTVTSTGPIAAQAGVNAAGYVNVETASGSPLQAHGSAAAGNMLWLENGSSSYANSSTQAFMYLTTLNRPAAAAFSWLKAKAQSSIVFHLRGDGNAYADGAWNGGGADVAEYLEWEDGNVAGEDRRGRTVVLVDDKVRCATHDDDPADIIGAVSTNPSLVADSDVGQWKGMVLRDDFGTAILQPAEIVSWAEEEADEDTGEARIVERSYRRRALPEGVIVPADALVTHVMEPARNPAWDATMPYVSREDRPEWVTIGYIGKLRLRKGEPVGPRWRRMREISEAVDEWLVR